MTPPRQVITGILASQVCAGVLLAIFLIAGHFDITTVAALCLILAGLCGLRALRQDGPDRSALFANLLAAFLLTTILTNTLISWFGSVSGSPSRFAAGVDLVLFAPMLILCVAAVYLSHIRRAAVSMYGVLGMWYGITGILFLACYGVLGVFLVNWLALTLTACTWFIGILLLPAPRLQTASVGQVGDATAQSPSAS